jgi:hypothetical protein
MAVITQIPTSPSCWLQGTIVSRLAGGSASTRYRRAWWRRWGVPFPQRHHKKLRCASPLTDEISGGFRRSTIGNVAAENNSARSSTRPHEEGSHDDRRPHATTASALVAKTAVYLTENNETTRAAMTESLPIEYSLKQGQEARIISKTGQLIAATIEVSCSLISEVIAIEEGQIKRPQTAVITEIATRAGETRDAARSLSVETSSSGSKSTSNLRTTSTNWSNSPLRTAPSNSRTAPITGSLLPSAGGVY